MQRGGTTFHLILIKPTHYDDDGYPIQWLRSAIPSNTLACLNGIAEDCRRRQVLRPRNGTHDFHVRRNELSRTSCEYHESRRAGR